MQNEFEVENILNRRKDKNGKVIYYLKINIENLNKVKKF